MKKLLVLGSAPGATDIIDYARSQGAKTIVADYFEPELSPAKQVADESWLISIADIDQLEQKCREENVTAVLAGASDSHLERALDLCERLDLPIYFSRDTWNIVNDKRIFKQYCRDYNIPVAKDYNVSDPLIEEELDAIGYPVVVKPVDSSGNKGLSICYSKDTFIEAFNLAKETSPTGQVMVEALLEGNEFSTLYHMENGDINLVETATYYRCDNLPPFCVMLISTLTENKKTYIEYINPKVIKLLEAIGCKHGPCFMQFKVDHGEIKLLEMNYRIDSGYNFRIIKDWRGVDLIKLITDFALYGETKEKTRHYLEASTKLLCSYMFWSKFSGKVAEIKTDFPIRKDMSSHILASIGKEIKQYQVQGNVNFTSDTREDIIDTIKELNERVAIYNEKGENMIEYFTCFEKLPTN